MFSSVKRHVSYANVVATLALVFAMSGGALAAKHYLVSSTKQISPKVLKKLKGKTGKTGNTGKTGATGPAGLQGAAGPQGKEGTTVVNRVRGTGAIESTGTEAPYALTNSTWSEGPTEAQTITASVSFNAPPESKCNVAGKFPANLEVEILIDGVFAGNGFYSNEVAGKFTKTMYTESGLVDNGATQSHTITAKVKDNCGFGGGVAEQHYTLESVNVDVFGAH